MLISVNGKQRDARDGMTITELLEDAGVKGPCAVELNRQVCPRRLHTQTELHNGDIVEIVRIVAGG